MSYVTGGTYEYDRAAELIELWHNGNCDDVATELHNIDSVLTAEVFLALASAGVSSALDDMRLITALLYGKMEQ